MGEVGQRTVSYLVEWVVQSTRTLGDRVQECWVIMGRLGTSARERPGLTAVWATDFVLTPIAPDSPWFLFRQLVEEIPLGSASPITAELNLTTTGVQFAYCFLKLSVKCVTGVDMMDLIKERLE